MRRWVDLDTLIISINAVFDSKTAKKVCEYLDSYIAVEEEPIWIPVEERVPEENGLYVVAIMAMGIAGPIYTRDLTDYEKESGWYARNVVAWLPCKLPEPYRPETLRREAGTEAGKDTAAQVLQSAT